MKNTLLAFLLTIALIITNPFMFSPINARVFAKTTKQLNSEIESIKQKIKEAESGQEITVSLKNGKTYHGKIKSMTNDSFQLAELSTNQVITLNYTEVKKVKKEASTAKSQVKKRGGFRSFLFPIIILGVVIVVTAIALQQEKKQYER
jgi:hypothetical protein